MIPTLALSILNRLSLNFLWKYHLCLGSCHLYQVHPHLIPFLFPRADWAEHTFQQHLPWTSIEMQWLMSEAIKSKNVRSCAWMNPQEKSQRMDSSLSWHEKGCFTRNLNIFFFFLRSNTWIPDKSWNEEHKFPAQALITKRNSGPRFIYRNRPSPKLLACMPPNAS